MVYNLLGDPRVFVNCDRLGEWDKIPLDSNLTNDLPAHSASQP